MNFSKSIKLVSLILVLALWVGTGEAQAPKIILVPESFPTIQEAIDAAADGDIVFISSGNYEENLTITKRVDLEGVDPERVTLTGVEEGQPVILVQSEEPIEVSLEKLTVMGAEGDCADYESGICPTGVTAMGQTWLTIGNSSIVDNDWAGIWFRESTRGEINSSDISGNGNGIVLWHSAQTHVEGSRIIGNGGMGIYLGNSARATLIANSILINVGCGIESDSNVDAAGEGNLMISNGADLCGNLSARLRVPLRQETETEIHFPSEDYQTLQEAIDALKPGGTITVAEGEHIAGVTVWKPLKLQGAGMQETILLGRGFLGLGPVVSLIAEAQGVVIEGLTISRGTTGITMGAAAQGKIDDTDISGHWRYGLEILGSAEAEIANSRVSGSAFRHGIVLRQSGRATIKDTIVSQNEEVGVWLSNSARATITDSTISENKEFGVVLLEGAQLTIRDNDISGNHSGIFSWDSTQATIEYNRIFDNNWDGIDLGGSARATIVNNELSYNSVDGIYVKGLAQATILDNLVFDNGYDGIMLNGKSITYIRGNKILNHRYLGITGYLKECGMPYGKDTFEATVKGGDNEIYDNEWWDVCPWELRVLEETKGGEYVPSSSPQDSGDDLGHGCASPESPASSSSEEAWVSESMIDNVGDLHCLTDAEVRRSR